MKKVIKINSLLLAIAVIYIFLLGLANLVKDMGIEIQNNTTIPKQVIILVVSLLLSLVLFGKYALFGYKSKASS